MSDTGASTAKPRRALLTRKLESLVRQTVFFALGLILLGLVLSYAFPGYYWFQRSGAVVMVLALVQIVRWRIALERAQFLHEASLFSMTLGVALKRQRSHPDTPVDESVTEAASIARAQYHDEKQSIDGMTVVLWFADAAFAAVGTLIWAFGDLVENKLFLCGHLSC